MTETLPPARILHAGDAAFVIELGETVDPAINDRILALDARLREAALPGVTELVPTYRSLLVHFDPDAVDGLELLGRLRGLDLEHPGEAPAGRAWTVPVCYGGEHGVDLEEVAERHGLTVEEAVRLHAGGTYRVYMIGFAPGFAYLGGLDQRLHTPRRVNPRLKTPAGSVSVGGIQAAISSVEAPSGWHLLGQTPVRAFDPGREPPFLFAAGDTVRFRPIDAAEFAALAARAADGDPLIRPEPASEHAS
ncbi:5-oxoprolinase subunit PxpB [Marinimicrococcus flavescens]|uniref:5-oxoprolinase subunit PxpB n=1 Tax=Marinimicrococcus flavescens TaxID=3031815 RepID=A0AAP3UZU9_9PROT|nr:5-oxoprolinase subunit PxpB [Marinimicrococcus flavescens]